MLTMTKVSKEQHYESLCQVNIIFFKKSVLSVEMYYTSYSAVSTIGILQNGDQIQISISKSFKNTGDFRTFFFFLFLTFDFVLIQKKNCNKLGEKASTNISVPCMTLHQSNAGFIRFHVSEVSALAATLWEPQIESSPNKAMVCFLNNCESWVNTHIQDNLYYYWKYWHEIMSNTYKNIES